MNANDRHQKSSGIQGDVLPASERSIRPLRLLTFSTLYPHDGRPNHGIFVENRLRHLMDTGKATSVVVAPVPWFPSKAAGFGDWSVNARAKLEECRHGVQIYHPRYLQLPAVGMSAAPLSLFMAARRLLKKLTYAGLDFDLIDAHYIYPDGVAAVALGKLFKKPVVLTARGSDITRYPDFALPRKMVCWAMTEATALISVSAGLKQAMVELGVQPQKIRVLRNGIDLKMFSFQSPERLQRLWGAAGPVLLSVGHLIERKGHHVAIRTLLDLPGWTLVVVGDGPERSSLQQLANQLGLSKRVIFSGPQPHSRLSEFYSAADVLILASSREGWANVLLEAMACGTPVVASNIPGNPEVVGNSAAGRVVAENTPECFAATIKELLDARLDRSQTRSYAEAFGWGPTSIGQLELFSDVVRTGVR